ncbi:MAG: PaaI family thioesterase [Acidimicrobiia bacterium]
MSFPATREEIFEYLRVAGADKLPGHLGFDLVELDEGLARMRCEIQPFHAAPNGFLHAGSVISLADTAAGYGCVGNLPDGGSGFTTIELKANFVGTTLDGVMEAEARLVHGGRTTQVWDVEVTVEATGQSLAHFRCTQMILYPRP